MKKKKAKKKVVAAKKTADKNLRKDSHGNTQIWSVFKQSWVCLFAAKDEEIAALPPAARSRAISEREQYRNALKQLKK